MPPIWIPDLDLHPICTPTKLAPGIPIRVEVIGKLPKAFAGDPKIGDLLP